MDRLVIKQFIIGTWGEEELIVFIFDECAIGWRRAGGVKFQY